MNLDAPQPLTRTTSIFPHSPTSVAEVAGSNHNNPIVVDEVEQAVVDAAEDLYKECNDEDLRVWLKDNGFAVPATTRDMLATLQHIREDLLNTLEVLEDKLEELMPQPDYHYDASERQNKRRVVA